MRFLRVFVSVAAVVCISIASIFLVNDYGKKVGPTISCSVDGDIEVACDVTDAELLSLVSATDEKDGDISSKIVIERKNYFLKQGVSIVIFSVSDSDNNVAQLSKQITYKDYYSPKITMHNDLIISRGNVTNLYKCFAASDVFDGDITSGLKMISPDYNYLATGEYNINCKVSNRFGDVRDITIKAIVTDEDYSAAQINLSEYLIYVKNGERPDFESYVSGIKNSAGKNYTVSNVTVDDSEFNADKAGVYNIYYLIKSGGKTVTKTRLIVVVEGE